MFEEYDEIITVDELMEILMIGKNTAYQLLNSGEINSFKIGRVHKIPKIAVEEYILNQFKNRKK
ncbi:MAG: helix-turn-helix domain-containing protein [Clostridiaceae bacterium]|nr:helix-turn-helix domain-containing protein [Clostridiaceae bacterium]